MIKKRFMEAVGFNPIRAIVGAVRMWRTTRAYCLEPASSTSDVLTIAVLVAPWMGTNVHWYSLTMGLLLARRGGCRVELIVDDLPIGNSPLRHFFTVVLISWVVKQVRYRHRIIRLSEVKGTLPIGEKAAIRIKRLAQLNAVWMLRGETLIDGRARYEATIESQLNTSYAAIDEVLKSGGYQLALIPGGIWGSSGAWVELSRNYNVRTTTFDSGGYGTLMLAVAGIASQHADIPRAFDLVKSSDRWSSWRPTVIEMASAEISRRKDGTDKFSSQMIDSASKAKKVAFDSPVLIALNSSWDSAALGLHQIFQNSAEWLIYTTRYLLDNTSADVIVRQHPAERLEIGRTTDDYKKFLDEKIGSHPRLHFISAWDEVNSYDLLSSVSAVVTYTTTLGIEAAALGKLVVSEANSYYADLGFIKKSNTMEQYEEHLCEAVTKRQSVSEAIKESALCCYYLTQCCSWIFTPFNPEGYQDYSRLKLSELEKFDEVKMVLEAIVTNTPYSYLSHLNHVNERSA